jgi:hypothetical protein
VGFIPNATLLSDTQYTTTPLPTSPIRTDHADCRFLELEAALEAAESYLAGDDDGYQKQVQENCRQVLSQLRTCASH